MAIMTEQEKIDWDNLYQYVRKLLGYDETMALPRFMVMRLKGMTEGKFYANTKSKPMAKYSFNTVYLTFVYCKKKIEKVLQTKNFKDEQSKFCYIMAIIESNINDVVLKLRRNEKNEQKIKNLEVEDYTIKVDKQTQIKPQSKKSDSDSKSNTFSSLTNDLW